MHCVDLGESRRDLSNQYLVTNNGFDTAENDEPCKACTDPAGDDELFQERLGHTVFLRACRTKHWSSFHLFILAFIFVSKYMSAFLCEFNRSDTRTQTQ